jgi:sensor histidine kinase YesM
LTGPPVPGSATSHSPPTAGGGSGGARPFSLPLPEEWGYSSLFWMNAQRARELARLRQEKNEADLRLTVLQAQVEPHFLFNTLASIHSLIRPDPIRAEATIEALVDHLRATMPKFRAEIGSTHSTLAQQIEVCWSYLAVMKVRMGHRLRYAVDVPECLRSHTFPPLMLISLVENAIKHGIEPSPSGGNIVMSAAVEVHGESQQLATIRLPYTEPQA